MATGNPYLDYLNEEDARNAQSAVANAASVGTDPDTEAKLQGFAKKYNLPVDAVRRQQPAIEKQAAIDSIDYTSLAQNNPAVSKFLATQAPIARDDVPNLSGIEQTVGHIGSTLAHTVGDWALHFDAEPNPSAGLGYEDTERLTMKGPTVKVSRAAEVAGRIAAGTGIGLARTGLNVVRAYDEHADPLRGFYGAGVQQRQQATFNQMDQSLVSAEQSASPRTNNPMVRGLYSGAVSMGQNLPGLALSMATANPAPALILGSVNAGGQAYGDARLKGLSPLMALKHAGEQGVIEWLTEVLPTTHLIDAAVKGTGFWKSMLRQQIEENIGEQVATHLQDLGSTLNHVDDGTLGDWWKARPQAALETAIATTFAAGAQTGGAHVLGSLARAGADHVERMVKAEQAQAIGETMVKLTQLAAASKVRARDPESFNSFLADAAKDGPTESVYIPAEHLAQLAQDPETMAALPAAAQEQLPEAMATGGTVQIPTEQWLKFATDDETSKTAEALQQHITFDPAMPSVAEAEHFMQTEGPALKAQVEKVLAQHVEDTKGDADRAQLHQMFAEALNKLRRFTPQTNEFNAALPTAFYATLAHDLGVTPQEAFAAHPLRTAAEDIAASEPTLSHTPEPLTAPPVDAEGNVQLTHYSGTEGLTQLDPGQWGTGLTANTRDERNRAAAGAPPRTYFGIAPGQPGGYVKEYGLGDHAYSATLPASSIYDAAADPQNIREQARQMIADGTHGGVDGKTLYERLIKEAGHAGYWVQHPSLGMVAAVFHPTQVTKTSTPELEQAARSAAAAQRPKPSRGEQQIQSLLETVPGLKRTLKYLKPTELAGVQARTLTKLQQLVDEFPKAEEMAAVAWSGRAKRGWYANSARALVEIFGMEDAPRFAALLAATSPQVSVESNTVNALNIWANWVKAGRPTDRAAIMKVMGRSVQGTKGEKSVLDAWKNNTVRALTAENPADTTLSGPKVNSFMLNLVGVTDEVTNDAWMANYALVSQDLFRKTGEVLPGKGPGYKAMAVVVRQAADILTRRTGEAWTPAEVQETVWSWAKTLYERANSADEKQTAEEILKASGLTAEEIASTPDFAGLLIRGIYRQILESAGYGEEVQKLADAESGVEPVRSDGSGSDPHSYEGSGFVASTFQRHLARAAKRLDALRGQRRSAAAGQDELDQSANEAPLVGLPQAVKVDGVLVNFGPFAPARRAAEGYAAEHGIPYNPPTTYARVDRERAERIAAAYEAMKNDPTDPEVAAAYEALKDETRAQFDAIMATGLKIEFMPPPEPGKSDIYGNPRNAILDVVENNHLYVFPTATGFGSETYADVTGNPLLEEIPGLDWGQGLPVTYNDVFRAVHDYFGHIAEGVGFRADGEENAWRQHSAMYSPLARRAMTTETRAQNSWVNFGPHAEHNQTADGANTKYALQKVGLMPDWVVTEGATDDGELHQFAGEGARTAPLGDLTLAKQREAAGVDAEEIRQETGWERGDDKRWRFEISDDEATFRDGSVRGLFGEKPIGSDWLTHGSSPIRLDQLIDHPKLFAAYPGLAKLKVVIDTGMRAKGAVVDGKTLVLNPDRIGDDPEGYATMATVLHEVQHLIQHAEGFATGGPSNTNALREMGLGAHLDASHADGGAGQVYRRLAGEIEARNTEARMDMTAEDRRLVSPQDTRDVGLGRSIVIAADTGRYEQADGSAPQTTQAAPRGKYAPGTNTITLLKTADLSTLLHELGHHFLEVMVDVASQPNAPTRVAQDVAILMKWFGVDSLQAWNGMSLDQQRENHEKFARGFEAYLFEGKAPSRELQGPFQRFRAWLLHVYRSLANLNVKLTPEVRGVFDRMLATDQEIAEAQQDTRFQALFANAETAGMTPEQFREYQGLGADAAQAAADALQTRSLRNLKWLSNARDRKIKELQREAEGKRRAMREDVTKEVMGEPVNRAREFLKRGMLDGNAVEGPHKMSIEEVEQLYGKQDYSKLGYGRYGMLARASEGNAIHPEQVAELFGYGSGDEMVMDLLTAEDPKTKINGLVDQRMLERYGDLNDEDTIRDAADAALLNDFRLRQLGAEYDALAKAVGSKKILLPAVKQFAAEMVNRLKIRDLKPARYIAAEQRAAAAAEKHARKGAVAEAAIEKRNQLINAYAERAARDAQDMVEKSLRYFGKFDRPGARRAIEPGYRDQIDQLLERYDLRTGQSLKAIDKRASLAAWVEAQKEQGFNPPIPPELLNEANRKHFKDMTVEELRGLVDTIKTIEHLGRLKQRLLTAADERAFKAVAQEFAETLTNNAVGGNKVPFEKTKLSRVVQGIKTFMSSHDKFAIIIQFMDGFTDNGIGWRTLVRPMNERGNYEAAKTAEATKALMGLFKPILKENTARKLFIPELGMSLSLEGRLMIALNWGNAANQQRVMDGFGWTEEQTHTVLRTLTAEQWRFVQGVWDHLDSYWPEIAAKEKRVDGVAPEKVEATPLTVETADGERVELQGGYFPLKYDQTKDPDTRSNEAKDIAKQTMQGAATRATTRRGHTEARQEHVEKPVRLDFGVIFQHVNSVIHDLAWHEWLIDANRLLRYGPIAQGINSLYGPETLDTLKKTVEDIAVGSQAMENGVEPLFRWLRSGASVAGLGLNLSTALLQPLGLFPSMVRIGPEWVLKGAVHWAGDAVRLEDSAKKAAALSQLMASRDQTRNRELAEINSRIRKGKWSQMEAGYYVLIQKFQGFADLPTFWGAYEKAMATDGMDEKTAVALAEQAVIDSQGGGQIKDLSQVERGGAFMKLWTSFYSYFNTMYNLSTRSVRKAQQQGGQYKGLVSPVLAVELALILAVPTVLQTALKHLMRQPDEDWDQFPMEALNDLFGGVTGLLVGVRDIGTALGPFGFKGPASTRGITSIGDLAQQAKQGDADEAFWRALNNTGGVLFHYPAGQIDRTVRGFLALKDGTSHNPLALAVGPPPKK